jgi:hypothetical protein
MRNRAAQIGVAGRRGIDELRFEVGPLHCHEVPGVGPAERAVHALPLLQRRIGDLDRAKNRLAAYRVKGTETDCYRRAGRDGGSLERDVIKRQRAGKFPEFGIDKYAADIVLRQQNIDDSLGSRRVAIGNVDEVGAAVRRDHDPRIAAVSTDQAVAILGCWPWPMTL